MSSPEHWNIFAVFNHDLEQVFIGASAGSPDELEAECARTAGEIENWQVARHHIDWVSRVESFPTLRHAQMYAAWLQREGAFEGAEHYVMGLDPALA